MHGRSDRKKKSYVGKQTNVSELSDYSSQMGASSPNLCSITSLSSKRMRTNIALSTKSSCDFEGGGSAKTKMMKEKIRANNEMFLLEQNVRKLELEKQKEQAKLKFIEDQEQRTKDFNQRKMRDLLFK